MNAALLAKLISAGTPADLVAEVAVELGRAQAAMETLEERRRKDRERKSIPRNSPESEEGAEIREQVSPDKEKSPRPPKEINPIPCVSGRARGYHRLPEGWRPTRPFPPQLQAKIDLWPPGALDDQIACLKRWAANAPDQNGKGRKRDWDKALWNWLTRVDDERYSRKPANSNAVGKSAAAFAMLNPGADEPF